MENTTALAGTRGPPANNIEVSGETIEEMVAESRCTQATMVIWANFKSTTCMVMASTNGIKVTYTKERSTTTFVAVKAN